jgi:hypothetical protein
MAMLNTKYWTTMTQQQEQTQQGTNKYQLFKKYVKPH